MLKARVEDRICDLLDQVSEFGEFETPEVTFDLRGKSAGQCRYKSDCYTLRFNLRLLRENTEDFLRFTVPHEVAHYVSFTLFGRVQPHGEEWKSIMRFFGIENPLRCHSYDISGSDPWKYRCSCQEHFLSSIRHARVTKGGRYICDKCKKELKFIEKIT